MNAETLELSYGETRIEFNLLRRERKTLSISVRPDLVVEVVAPIDASLERVFEKVRKRAPWIMRQLQFFGQFQPRTTERRYVSGETHLYLGRQYKLRVVPHVQQQVKLYRGILVVQSHKAQENSRTKLLLENWYKTRANLKFSERLELCRKRFPDPDEINPKSIVVRRLQQRWGSMTPTGKLILNRSLIKASVDALDYVITHELCHIRHPHHGSAFFDFLDRVMPDWEHRKLKLERQLA
ncbi:SprT family zinc-dependent metalloprotease [uncultured Ruegeria sp.]|uniref:M48 family metallopeptidase n=1 Tax=uncultured Ruegeria sp. TaxID=259304 RepID=UPI002630DE85|nr:SprT family zinc-dependent metalloprotease [uncultured Ruegeria sp.]